jgi:hypothetical protein
MERRSEPHLSKGRIGDGPDLISIALERVALGAVHREEGQIHDAAEADRTA